ncbi:MAG: hypothetical protein KatS3mg102_2969 [Planctomycetota bacterium]|nr:MAG: hypothetical protein KatS3mg102_2969 [Planctomycetota bacterium]
MRRGPGAILTCVVTACALMAVPVFAAPSKEVREAEQALAAALRGGELAALEAAVARLVAFDTAEAAAALLQWAERVPPGADRVYWRLLGGAASMRSQAALEVVAERILGRNKVLGRDLLFALQNNRSQHVPLVVLRPVLLKGADDLQLLAAEQCGAIESVEAVDVLLEALEKAERKGGELQQRLLAGLKHLTGADLGAAANWRKWWQEQRPRGLPARKDGQQGVTVTGTAMDDLGLRAAEIGRVREFRKEQVLVVVANCKRGGLRGCNFDDIAGLLERMRIPHTVVTKEEFEQGKVDLGKALVVLNTCVQIHEHCVCPSCVPGGGPAGNRLVQCTGCDVHEIVHHKFSGAAVEKIRRWVEAGGYLFSEDWGLADVLERAWPKLIRQGSMMKQRTVTVTPGRGMTTHPLLRGVFVDPEAARRSQGAGEGTTVSRNPAEAEASRDGIVRYWAIDDDSPYIEVVGPGVTVLMESEELAQAGGPSSRAVAVTFLPKGGGEAAAIQGRPERLRGGRVLHVLSHFGKQRTDLDEFSLQNLLLNFLLEAQERATAR